MVDAVYQAQDSAQNSNSQKLALLAFGPMAATADAAAKALMADTDLQGPAEISVVNMRWVKPLDTQLIDELIAKGYTHIVTLEEHAVMGGAGSAVNEYLLNHTSGIEQQLDIKNIGIADEFIAHGSHDEQLADCGLDVAGVTSQLRRLFAAQ